MTEPNPWQPIEIAPKDGSLLELTWLYNGDAQDIWPMQWSHIQKNGFFPGKVGFWTAPDGSMTWDDSGEWGPTHWRFARSEVEG